MTMVIVASVITAMFTVPFLAAIVVIAITTHSLPHEPLSAHYGRARTSNRVQAK